MLAAAGQRQIADLHGVAAVGRHGERQQRIAASPKSLLSATTRPDASNNVKHGVGLRADGVGRDFEDQPLPGAGVERKTVDVSLCAPACPKRRLAA